MIGPSGGTMESRAMNSGTKAVVLLSGGMDSTTALAVASRRGFAIYALSFRYGQRHDHELHCAAQIARYFDVAQHVIFDVNIGQFGGSALTSELEVPKDRAIDDMQHGIPITYVPARNTVFLSIALAWAEVLGSRDVFIGVNALDYSGYPDCRPEYIEAFERMANLATKAGVGGAEPLRIHTPLIQLTKAQIVELGRDLGVAFGLTSTCYDPRSEGQPCGRCDACLLRQKGFREAGVEDPLTYAPEREAV
jgi:7-cyano-7-deazaguanine synthase